MITCTEDDVSFPRLREDQIADLMARAEAAEAEVERLREALGVIKWEAGRENGNWVHLKRCIHIQASQALGETK